MSLNKILKETVSSKKQWPYWMKKIAEKANLREQAIAILKAKEGE